MLCAINFACNSPATLSRFELASLELQRFRRLLKVHAAELHAKFLVGVCAFTHGYYSQSGQVLWSGVIVLCPSGWVMR